jgi:rhodanese-related sulfurtransferase
MMDDGALLIDIRQPEEFAREHIDRAQLHPLSMLTAGSERLVFIVCPACVQRKMQHCWHRRWRPHKFIYWRAD